MRPFLTLALLCLAAGCASKARPEPIWVGHLAPLSGADREQGEASIRAIQTVLEQAREDDFTVAGRSVGVRHVNSATGTARAEATRLLAVNRVAALIVGPGVTEVEEILAAARSHSAPVIVLNEMARPPDSSDVILLGLDPGWRGEALAKVAKEKLKASSAVIVVDSENPVWVALADSFEAQWRKGKGRSRRLDLAALQEPATRKQLSAAPPDVYLAAVPTARLNDPKAHLGELLA